MRTTEFFSLKDEKPKQILVQGNPDNVETLYTQSLAKGDFNEDLPKSPRIKKIVASSFTVTSKGVIDDKQVDSVGSRSAEYLEIVEQPKMHPDESCQSGTNEAGSVDIDPSQALKSKPMYIETPEELSVAENPEASEPRNSQIEHQSTTKISQRMVILDKLGSPAKNQQSDNTTERSVTQGDPSHFQSQDRMPTRLNDQDI